MTREAWIIDGVRTPRGKGRATGALHGVHPQELFAQCLKALESRIGFAPSDIDDVVVGNLDGTGDHGACIGRLAVLAAGWPQEVPGLTLNRFCGSGQQAATFAAMGVLSGMQQAVICGGVESMSRWPQSDVVFTIDGGNPRLRENFPIVPQGVSADLIASLGGFTREECDRLALESQMRAGEALRANRFVRSIIPVRDADGNIALDRDEHVRESTTLSGLSALPPAFEALGTTVIPPFTESFDHMCLRMYPSLAKIDHVHHAGNSSGIVDGAAAILVTSSDFARAHGLVPRARVVMSTVAGSEPVVMLTGPAAASQRCLAAVGMTTNDIDLWEINEAFASVVLHATRELALDHANVNRNGGAIALGHPIGATGTMLIETAIDELERADESTALITMCTGAGMATATIVDRV